MHDVPPEIGDPARRAAEARSGPAGRDPWVALDDVVRLALRATGAAGAAVTVLDGDRCRVVAAAGTADDAGGTADDAGGPRAAIPVQAQPADGSSDPADSVPSESCRCAPVISADDLVAVGEAPTGNGPGAWIAAPVRSADGFVLGCLEVTAPAARAWTADDLDAVRLLAQAVTAELAGRRASADADAASAVSVRLAAENAQLVRAVREALVPGGTWTLGSLEISTAVWSPSPDVRGRSQVADVSALPRGRWGITLGAVDDEGVGSAALAAFVRTRVRRAALAGLPPAEVVRLVDHDVFDRTGPYGPDVALVFLEVGLLPDGDLQVEFAGGGQVPMVRRGADGGLDWLPVDPRPLNNEVGPPRRTYRARLAPGEVLVLFTGTFGVAALPGDVLPGDVLPGDLLPGGSAGPSSRTLAARLAGVLSDPAPPSVLPERIGEVVARVARAEGRADRDDVTVIVLRLAPEPGGDGAPEEPAVADTR